MKILKVISQLLIFLILTNCSKPDKHIGYWLGRNNDNEVFGINLREDGKAVFHVGSIVYGPEIKKGDHSFDVRYKIKYDTKSGFSTVDISMYGSSGTAVKDLMMCSFQFVNDKKAFLLIYLKNGNRWSEHQAILTKVE